MQSIKKTVVFILGGPGSGKGTQCELIVKKFNYAHLSAGDLLREERKTPGSQFGEIITKRIDNGQIVPSEITVSLLKRAMQKSASQKFLIDGFPRNIQNYDVWEKIVGDSANVPFVVNFECSEQTLEKRLLKRSETSGRADDSIDIIKKRFKVFQSETMEVISLYSKQQKLVTVNSEGSIESIFQELSKHFQKLE